MIYCSLRGMLDPANSFTVDLHQAQESYFGVRCAMVLLRLFLVLFLVVPGGVAAPASDTINERIPVSRAELEAHWKVDCRATWSAVQALADGALAGKSCRIGPESRRILQLCVFIHQPPGGADTHTCPDYRAVLAAADAAGSTQGCAALANILRRNGSCQPAD